MRIIYFSSDYTPHDHRFLEALAKTDHEVFFLRLEKRSRATEFRQVPRRIKQVAWAGGKRSFRWRDVPLLTRDLKRIINRVKPDLIHAGPIQTCAFLSVLSGFRPVLTMSWGFDLLQDAGRNAWWRLVTWYTLHNSSFFVSDASVTRDLAMAYGMRANRTSVFPWGVDLKHFSPGSTLQVTRRSPSEAKAAQAITRNSRKQVRQAFVLLCNRSWEPTYGVDVLAKAFVKAGRKDSRLALVLLGEGSQSVMIRQILTDGGMIDRVKIGGQVPQTDLPAWYRRANLFVSPSHVDGSSVSLMEALACGLPVLVSDIPANKEWVQENVNGWLFPDGDSNELANRILLASKDPGKLSRMSRAAREIAQERADWRKNFAILLDAYEVAAQPG